MTVHISDKNNLKFIQSDVSVHEYLIRKKHIFFSFLSLFLFSFSFSLFSYLGDQCMSLDIGFETIVLLITTIIQTDKMHISAKKSLKSIPSDVSIHEYRIRRNMFLFLFPYWGDQ